MAAPEILSGAIQQEQNARIAEAANIGIEADIARAVRVAVTVISCKSPIANLLVDGVSLNVSCAKACLQIKSEMTIK